MSTRRHASRVLPLLALMFCVSAPAFAQSSIAGLVKDTSGGVLPGVTVEAASPVLIEKVRTVTTDAEGLYKIVDLRPGTYTITFSLPGFTSVKREGVELTSAFTATVNADLQVGNIAETLTVSGAAPTVDVQNVLTGRTVQRDVISAVPTGSRSYVSYAVLNPGVTTSDGQDVGGSVGVLVRLAVHDSRTTDTLMQLDSLSYSAGGTTSGRTGIHINDAMVQEISLGLGGLSAENALGGVVSNVIPREGGNNLKGFFLGAFTNHNLQSNNLTPALQGAGLKAGTSVKQIWDINPALGGPLKKDRLWIYAAARYWGTDNYVAGDYYNQTPTAFTYTPDYNHQADTNLSLGSENVRFTWQATPRNKVNIYYEDQQMVEDHYTNPGGSTANDSPEAWLATKWTPNYLVQATWSSPVTSRLLLESGMALVIFNYSRVYQPSVSPDTPSIVEASTGFGYRAPPGGATPYSLGHQGHYRASASYVTGSHAVKVGLQFENGWSYTSNEVKGASIGLGLLNGAPRQVTEYVSPLGFHENLKANLGLYGQDQWKIKRLALNLGVRFDWLNAYVPVQSVPAGQLVPARNFPAVANVPNWTDVSPRLGAAYDLFGDGKTAIKGSISRYLGGIDVTSFTRQANPEQASVTSATRTWTDSNNNQFPDCDFHNTSQNGECGPLSNLNFGQTVVTQRYDPSVTDGFGKRPYSWEGSAGIDRQLISNVAVSGAFYRRWYGNLTATQNLLTTPANYSPYCFTAPVDPRLPNGGGNQLCGFYDIDPLLFGKVNNLITFSSKFGNQTEVYTGFDFTTNVRLPKGIRVSGGLNTGHTVTNTCFVVNTPQELVNCKVTPPFQNQIKFLAVYPLPWWNIQTSVAYQGLPGPQILANYVVTNNQIAPSLGRNLAQGANGQVTLPLIAPGTLYADRLNQTDFRITKTFNVGKSRIQGNFDMYNLFNGTAVLTLNSTYGPSWQQPNSVLQGRLLKFSAQLTF